MWINLIDNAVKFSQENNIIELNIHEEENTIFVSVINFGEEIPSENQKRIFDKFYQTDSSHSTEGNGIGLAVVKQVVALHHGTVFVRSENSFTLFTVTLPQNQ